MKILTAANEILKTCGVPKGYITAMPISSDCKIRLFVSKEYKYLLINFPKKFKGFNITVEDSPETTAH